MNNHKTSTSKSSVSPELIVALDQCSSQEAKEIVEELCPVGISWFKVGLELYTQTGPQFVRFLKEKGLRVFLDLKLYDIPNTVAKAVKAAAETKSDLLTVHCSGGATMLREAQKSAEGTSLKLLGVTVLTSFGSGSASRVQAGDDFAEVTEAWGGQPSSIGRAEIVANLAAIAAESGLPGIVCSVPDLDSGLLKNLPWRSQPILVTPGIRSLTDSVDDQKSVATASHAIKAGSTHLVVGRPITTPKLGSRAMAAQKFLAELKGAYGISTHS